MTKDTVKSFNVVTRKKQMEKRVYFDKTEYYSKHHRIIFTSFFFTYFSLKVIKRAQD